tara:strand:+ start:10632 stop:11204 length:573 start_codon:yes stop_codon:yes gene_type:complete
MPPKKKRRVTASNHWSTIATLSKSNAVLAKQKEQYAALLKQLSTIVDKEWTGPNQAELIRKQVTVWIGQTQEQQTNLTTLRDEALTSLRSIDVLDNDTLTTSAATLTEQELQLQTHRVLLDKFERIVRYKSDNTFTLTSHTSKWITRFTTQWNKTNAVFNQNILMLRKSVEWLAAVFPELVATTQSIPKG